MRLGDVVQLLTLEQVLTLPMAFGLETASPLQRAICRVIAGDNLAELSNHPDVIQAIGEYTCDGQPKQVSIVAAIRGGKSLICAAAAIYASQHCDVSGLAVGDVPRISVVSLTVDLARVIYKDHLVGKILAKACLSDLLMDEPTGDTLILRHPTGRPIEIRVVAGARAGSSLVARWSAGAIFDEAPRMHGHDEAVVNLEDAHTAVAGRLLPGAQIINVGSPWAPLGPIYRQVSESWKKPSKRLVVIRAPGPALNPVLWTPEVCEDLRKNHPDAYATDVEVQFLARESQLFDATTLDKATRANQGDTLHPRAHYVAAIDPATRGNAFTLVILTREKEKRSVALVSQWIGTATTPLDTRKVMREMKPILDLYRIKDVWSDMWSFDANRAIAADCGFSLLATTLTEREKTDAYLSLKTAMVDGRFELHADPVLRSDLDPIMRRVTQAGLSIYLPTTSDGRHCDYAPALMLASTQYIPDMRPDPLNAEERARKAAQAMLERELNPPRKPLR